MSIVKTKFLIQSIMFEFTLAKKKGIVPATGTRYNWYGKIKLILSLLMF